MGIIIALIVGFFVGGLARFLMPGRDPAGWIVTALLGVAGSIVAFVFGWSVGWYHGDDSSPGFIASLIGAMVVLAVYRMIARRR